MGRKKAMVHDDLAMPGQPESPFGASAIQERKASMTTVVGLEAQDVAEQPEVTEITEQTGRATPAPPAAHKPGNALYHVSMGWVPPLDIEARSPEEAVEAFKARYGIIGSSIGEPVASLVSGEIVVKKPKTGKIEVKNGNGARKPDKRSREYRQTIGRSHRKPETDLQP